MARFDDRVILITGAASGIGRASAERIAGEGGKWDFIRVDGELMTWPLNSPLKRNMEDLSRFA